MEPTVEMLAKIVEAAGFRLDVEPVVDSAVSVAGLAQRIRDDLASDPDDITTPVRRAGELVARFGRADGGARRRVLAARPVPTGSARWDALLAGLAEWLAVSVDMDPPGWVFDRGRYLERAWWVAPMPSMRAWEYAGTPMALKLRGVYLHRDSLAAA